MGLMGWPLRRRAKDDGKQGRQRRGEVEVSNGSRTAWLLRRSSWISKEVVDPLIPNVSKPTAE